MSATTTACPTCGNTDPELHPAYGPTAEDYDVAVCPHPWHGEHGTPQPVPLTLPTAGGDMQVLGMPAAAAPGLVIVPEIDHDRDQGGPLRYSGWAVRHAATGKRIVGCGFDVYTDILDAERLAERLGALGLDWAGDPVDWPEADKERAKQVVLRPEPEVAR